jgi:PAS domain S-box-containing protein
VRILIVDDHEVVRRGVRALLSAQPDFEVCGEAVDGLDAIAKALELKPDIVVMDISMPNLNGLDATRRIRTILPQIEVLILSQHDSAEMLRQAFNAGARGYVVKSSISKDLLAALKKVSERETIASDAKVKGANAGAGGALDTQEILQRSKAFETALRNSEELFRSTFELAPLGVGHVAPDGRWLRFNLKLCEILGYTRDEFARLAYQDITHPDDRAAVLAEADKILAGTSDEFSIERRSIHKDGSVGWANLTVSAVRDAERKVKYFICIVEDVSKRRFAENARLWLEAVVDSSDDAIISKNLDGIITSWNGGAERTFGWTAEEAVGKSITLLIPLELRDEETQILKRLRAGEHISHFETVRVTKAGKKLDVSLSISPVKNSEGVIIGASKIARDVTARKLAEAELIRAHDELERRVEERTHDLQDKNNELVKQAEIVRELSARLLQLQDAERRHIARELHDSVGQYLAAMNMNIAAVRREKEKLSSTAAQCLEDTAAIQEQLSNEIRTMSYLLHPPLLDESGLESAIKWYIEGFAERSKIKVNLKMPPDLERLPRELELSLFRIVQECLTNVHRHSGSSTAVVRLSESRGKVKLEVKDRGKGIPREKLNGSTGKSLGVGLRGMRERVRQLGGDLQVESDENGTSVTALLPVGERENAEAGAQESTVDVPTVTS